MQAWHTPEGYDVGCLVNVESWKECATTSIVSLQERDCIATLHAEGRSIAYIAAEIGRDSSSVCHKFKRNARHGRFRACTAQKEGG